MTPEEKIDLYIQRTIKAMAIAGSIIALIIFTDYLLPGNVVAEPVVWKSAEISSSHRSRHNAYRVNTPNRYFYCSRDFFTQLNDTDTLILQLSPVFAAVNAYACNRFMPESHTFSLRYVSGLFLPLLMWIFAFLSWKNKYFAFYIFVFIISILNLITLIILI